MKKFVILFLILLGLYFVFDHRYPLPFNHEQIGLGVNHFGHTIFGVVLVLIAVFIWLKEKNKSK